MKKIYITLIIALSVCTLQAQEESEYSNSEEFKTVFGRKSIGGYGGFGLGYTMIGDQPGLTFDARGAVVLGHSFALGIGGAGFISSPEEERAYNAYVSMVGGYGGIVGEIILFPRSPVHLSFPVLAGLGASGVAISVDQESYSANEIRETSLFMIVEPAVELEFNLTRYFRMAAFFSYRYTTDLDYSENYTENIALTNFSTGIRLKFGKF